MTTCERLRQNDLPQMESPLTPSVGASPASHLAARHEGAGSPLTFGHRWTASSVKSGQDWSLPKTSKNYLCGGSEISLGDGVIDRLSAVLAQMQRGLTIREIVGGPVHTPTTKANFGAPSMQKWGCCRRYVAAFGALKITPEQFEFLMGFPIGWTDLER
jgi:hypothetical protein